MSAHTHRGKPPTLLASEASGPRGTGTAQFCLERRARGTLFGALAEPVLAGLHDQLPAPPGDPEQPAILLIEALTEREREVLRHLSGLLSGAEIASEMDISIHTVKTHLKSIYRKLAATRRGEAVRRARQLELI